jgi:hypothetical protein
MLAQTYNSTKVLTNSTDDNSKDDTMFQNLKSYSNNLSLIVCRKS